MGARRAHSPPPRPPPGPLRRRRKRHAVRYQPCGLDEHVYLHPRSALHGSSPELLVFLQLLRTDKRPYMAGLTAVEVRGAARRSCAVCSRRGAKVMMQEGFMGCNQWRGECVCAALDVPSMWSARWDMVFTADVASFCLQGRPLEPGASTIGSNR